MAKCVQIGSECALQIVLFFRNFEKRPSRPLFNKKNGESHQRIGSLPDPPTDSKFGVGLGIFGSECKSRPESPLGINVSILSMYYIFTTLSILGGKAEIWDFFWKFTSPLNRSAFGRNLPFFQFWVQWRARNFHVINWVSTVECCQLKLPFILFWRIVLWKVISS